MEVDLVLEQPGEAEHAARLLGPAQPYRIENKALRFRVARDGTAPSPDGIQRLLRRIDVERIHGRLTTRGTSSREAAAARVHESLVASWDAAEQSLPSDWSHLFAELELQSTDYVERASLNCVPMNLRRVGDSAVLNFRVASTFGYGTSRSMVRRCLERCDADGISGTVRILNAVSGVDSVSTQGPTWFAAGRNV